MKKGRIFFSFAVALVVAFTFLFGSSLLLRKDEEERPEIGIVTVWHIDTFEGGVGSRKQFLLDTAAKYQKTNTGSLIMVIGFTEDGANAEMEKGNYPDVLSFGAGVKLGRFVKLNGEEYPEGNVNGEQAAKIWAKGNYAVFYKGESLPDGIDKITVSTASNTLPLVAFSLSGYTAEKIVEKSPLDAYYDFVNGNTDYLLGTQRDAHRLINRNFNFNIIPLDGFSDLNQFIAVTTTDEKKVKTASKFIDFLLSDKVQESLYKIGLFSVKSTVEYENEKLKSLSELKTNGISVLYGAEKIDEIRELSRLSATGDKDALKKINKLLF